MSTPSSMHPTSSRFECQSVNSSLPSTAVVCCLIATQVHVQFLKTLFLRAESGDIALVLSGSGDPTDASVLLSRTEELLGISIMSDYLWESAKFQDRVDDYRTNSKSLVAKEGNKGLNVRNVVMTGRIPSHASALNLFTDSHLRLVIQIKSSALTLYVLERPAFTFPRISLTPVHCIMNPTGTPYGMPSFTEFRDLWRAWDTVTLRMIPQKILHEKPIDLRHKILFYLGHIPTFVNILLSKLLKEPYTEPKKFTTIFERGIDPHVDDPNHCHNHSEVPERDEDWPSLQEVLDYRDRVRERLANFYHDVESGKRTCTRRIARTLVMILEHEGFHVETLLYMAIQRADSDGQGTLPPPGFKMPLWEVLREEWESIPPPLSPTVTLGPELLVMGHDDCENDDTLPDLEHQLAGHEFGWDNESPRREVMVEKFKIDARPVTNGEFYAFWKQKDVDLPIPVSWVEENGEVKIRTVYGPVPMSLAANWPVLTSFDSLSTYAKSKGGRVPTEHELRMFLDEFGVGYEEGANVGFRNWHPLPATALGSEQDGRGSNGGVWEWTSTVLDVHAGFVGTNIFPGYSSDFFDTKHMVVLGASYATIPRLSNRRTLRNFYQHNYPYAWVGGRVAYDA